MGYAYWIEGEYRVREEPLCIPVEPIRAAMEGPPGVRHPVEVWEHHPWAMTDPKVPTYQDCPRCGARRVAIPDALANAAAGQAGHDRRAGHDPEWEAKHPHAERLAESERRRGRLSSS